MSILFLHGLEGSYNGTKAEYLRSRFGEEHVITPAWRVSNRIIDCLAAICQATAHLPKSDELVAVGSSFGGYLATLLERRIPQVVGYVLINPAMVGRPRQELIQQFPDSPDYPIQRHRGCIQIVLLSNQDEVCDPDLTEAFYEGVGHVIRVDDGHRASKPATLQRIGDEITRVEAHWFIPGFSDD